MGGVSDEIQISDRGTGLLLHRRGNGAHAQMVASHAPTSAAAASAPAAATASFPAAAKAVNSGADAASLNVTGKAVVKVNDAELTDRDLLREMFAIFPYAKQHGGFPKKQEAEIRQGAMQMIIFEELVYQEAQRRKMTIAPARITREENNFKGQFSSRGRIQRISEDGTGRVRGEAAAGDQTLAADRGHAEAGSGQQVGGHAGRGAQLLREESEGFEHGETFALQTISIIPPDKASAQVMEDARKRAEGILAQAKATKNYEQFGLLAEKVSEDDFRVNMGDRHVVKSEKLPPEVVKVAQKMKAGEVSGLIPLGTAWTIIRVNAHTPPGKAKFVEVKARLMTDLKKQKYEQLTVGLDKRLHENAQIQEM